MYAEYSVSQVQISWGITPKAKYIMVADFIRYYRRITISCGFKFHEIWYQNQNSSWLQISITISYSANFMRYYTRIKMSHGCRFHEILHQNQNISWLQISWDILPQSQYLVVRISWDITPESKYLMVADFMRYNTRITISHGCRFHEILHQNQNISWLQISWDITPESKYLMVQISWDITPE